MSLEMVESGGEGQRRVRGKELVSGEEEGEEHGEDEGEVSSWLVVFCLREEREGITREGDSLWVLAAEVNKVWKLWQI